MKQFTLKQRKAYKSYERVRASGRYNMLEPQARIATGLSVESFAFVMDHYAELRIAVKGNKAHA